MGYTEELPVTTSPLSSLSCFSVEATEAPSTAAGRRGAGGAGVAPKPDVAAAAAHGHDALLVSVKFSQNLCLFKKKLR